MTRARFFRIVTQSRQRGGEPAPDSIRGRRKGRWILAFDETLYRHVALLEARIVGHPFADAS